MKKRLIILSASVVLIAVLVWFAIFRDARRYSINMAIPANALFIVRTPSFNNVYNKLKPNTIWQSLKDYPYFQEYHRNIELADSLAGVYPTLRSLVTDRPFALSCHRLPSGKYDFLYVCDLQKLNVIKTFEDFLPALIKDYGLRISKQPNRINRLLYENYIFYYTFQDNLLIGSLSEELVKESVKTCEDRKKQKTENYKNDITLYLNHRELGHWLGSDISALTDKNETAFLDSTFLSVNLKNEEIVFTGCSLPDTAYSPILNAIKSIGGGTSHIKEIAGDNTASYLSFCYSSFADLKKALTDNYRTQNPGQWNTYDASLQKLNKFLKIDVLDIFTSWIGNEIALIKPECAGEQPMQTVILAIHSKDIDYAQDQLNYLSEQIRLRTPVKFRNINYNGYTINYLSLKGFFRLFARGLFDRLEKPYYTIIGDYVLFSNSPAALTTTIKKYILGQTLANSEKYNVLNTQLDNDSNIQLYVNMPNLYRYLYLSIPEKSRKELNSNRNAALSFEQFGMELTQDEGLFKTRIVARYNLNAPEDYEIKEINENFEQLADEIESGRYLPAIPDSILISTLTDYTWESEKFIMKGRLKDGAPEGFWNIYNRNNRLAGQVPFDNGKANGLARLFYDNDKLKAEIEYDRGNIKTYREYFPDGILRTELEYRRGKRHGTAHFYYTTGHLLCEGKYKKGLRSGTWHYYKVTGENDKKVKF